MNFSFFIAKRYFFTNKKRNFVNLISWVSLFGVAIGTATLILVLSVFNGFENLILKMYNSFDPHLKITVLDGKVFDPKSITLHHPEILEKAYVLEEKVLLKHQQKEFLATVKGVSNSYKDLTQFDSLLVQGQYMDAYQNTNVAVVGRGVAYHLSMALGNIFNQLEVYIPNRSENTLLNPKTAFKQASVLPVGIFGIQSEIDEKYIITPLKFIQDLTFRGNKVSAIEIWLKDDSQTIKVQEKLKSQLEAGFIVRNRLEQQEFLYKILNTEKLAVSLILAFIMVIATFNIVGSLTMLILDKRESIKVLKSFGTTKDKIKVIFFTNSMFVVSLGTILGIFIGLLIAFLQQKFGLVSMGDGSFVIKTYPILVKLSDIFIISATVLVIGAFASWLPASLLSRKFFKA